MTSIQITQPLKTTTSSSSVVLSNVAQYPKNKSRTEWSRSATLGFAIMLFSAPFSTGIEYSPTLINNSSSIISYQNIAESMYDISIFQDFISNILINSINIDSDIVDMVNENFWDLI